MASTIDDPQALQRCIRELVGLSALPAAWIATPTADIPRMLAEILLRSLAADVAYVRISRGPPEYDIEAALGSASDLTNRSDEICDVLSQYATLHSGSAEPSTIPNPFGDGHLRAAIAPVGPNGESGLIIAASHRPDFPSEIDRLLLKLATNQTGIVIKGRQAHESLDHSEESLQRAFADTERARQDAELALARLERLEAVMEATLTPRRLDELLGELVKRTRAALDADTAVLLILDASRTSLVPVASDGFYKEVGSEPVPIGRGVAGRIAMSDAGLIVDDLATVDLVRISLREHVRSLVGAPLRLGGSLMGVIHVGSMTTGRFTPADLGFLRLVADRIVLAIERVRLDEAEHAARIRAEMAVQQLRLAVDAGRMGTWEWKVGSDELLRSPGVEAIYGYAPGTFPGTVDAFQDRIHPDDRDRVIGELSTVGERRQHHIEYRIVRADGAVRWVEERGQLFVDANGRPDRIMGVCTDITERKQAEEAREQLLMREQAARAELERAARVKDDFLALLSHELRTPLNAILGYAHLLGLRSLPPERAGRALEAIQRNAQAQGRLIESLLDLSRIVAGKLELDRRPIDVSSVVQASVDVVRPVADAKGVALSVVVPSAAVTALGDGGRLQQVFWNLLSNAVKFTPPGGRVEIHVAQADSSAQVQVIDTGQGITAEFLPSAFERFTQARAMEGAPGGLGLGLALVRELVQAHGGNVTAASPGEGRGSTFTVTLPVHAEATVSVESAPIELQEGVAADDLRSLLKVKVLIVDDDDDARDWLGYMLESRGAVVRTVPSARNAFQAIARERPDVLLADLGMSDEDGYTLIRNVRAGERERQEVPLPAVAVTAYAGLAERERALTAGFDRHIAKPVDVGELVRTVAVLANVRRGHGDPR